MASVERSAIDPLGLFILFIAFDDNHNFKIVRT